MSLPFSFWKRNGLYLPRVGPYLGLAPVRVAGLPNITISTDEGQVDVSGISFFTDPTGIFAAGCEVTRPYTIGTLTMQNGACILTGSGDPTYAPMILRLNRLVQDGGTTFKANGDDAGSSSWPNVPGWGGSGGSGGGGGGGDNGGEGTSPGGNGGNGDSGLYGGNNGGQPGTGWAVDYWSNHFAWGLGGNGGTSGPALGGTAPQGAGGGGAGGEGDPGEFGEFVGAGGGGGAPLFCIEGNELVGPGIWECKGGNGGDWNGTFAFPTYGACGGGGGVIWAAFRKYDGLTVPVVTGGLAGALGTAGANGLARIFEITRSGLYIERTWGTVWNNLN